MQFEPQRSGTSRAHRRVVLDRNASRSPCATWWSTRGGRASWPSTSRTGSSDPAVPPSGGRVPVRAAGRTVGHSQGVGAGDGPPRTGGGGGHARPTRVARLIDFLNSPGGTSETFRCFLARGLAARARRPRAHRRGRGGHLPQAWVALDEARDLVWPAASRTPPPRPASWPRRPHGCAGRGRIFDLRDGARPVRTTGSRIAGRTVRTPSGVARDRMSHGVGSSASPRGQEPGVPRSDHPGRGAASWSRHGHEVFVETDAGVGSSITDDEFVAAGARILPTADGCLGDRPT